LHAWRVELDAIDDGLGALLTAQERERAGRMVQAREGTLWSRSRGVLRALLGRYLGADPASIELTFGAHGKPLLAGPGPTSGERARPGNTLHFNLSHSGAVALYAFGRFSAVGVDVQLARDTRGRGQTDYAALAARVFGPERAERLRALAPDARELEFLRLWTRHEAELKRRGTGIGGGPANASSDPEPPEGASPWIAELKVRPRAFAAIACERAPSELRLWDWG
jgi:4'-phosphopantetheinyl transferase